MASVLSKPYFHDKEAAYAKVESIVRLTGSVCQRCHVLSHHLERARSGV